MCKIILADDHKIVTESLIQTFEDSEQNIQIVGTAENGLEAIELLKKNSVDIAILDIRMPDMDGIDTLRWIKKERPDIKVLMLTMYNDADRIKMAMQSRAHGYLLKNRSGKEVVEAVKTLMKGEYYFPPDIRDLVFDSHIPKDFLEEELMRMKLTEREEEIISLLAAGDRVKDIAAKLFIDPKTVETHKSSLMKKIKAGNVQDVVRFAVKNGYCP